MEKFTNIISDLKKNLIQNSLTRAVRMISKPAEVSEKKEKLKEVEKIFQWEDQVIQFQKERDDLANRREVAEKENENSIISLLEEKDKEIRNWQARIKKLSKNLNESEVKEFIIDRSKSDQEIENQIDRLAEKFQEIEQNQAQIPEENDFQEIEDLEPYSLESDDSAEMEIPPIVNYPQKKRRKKAEPLEVKIDLGGKYSFCEYAKKQFGRK